MRSVTTNDGVRIAFRVRGEGPLNLVFMHGWGGSGAYFNELIDAMDPDGVRCITPDLRGHGDSDKPEGGYDLRRFAADVLAVADAAGADRFVLVGFSMSGKFAQFVACERPDRVIGQVLIAGAPAASMPFPDDLRRDWVGRAGSRERLDDLVRTFISRPVADSVIERYAADAARVPEDGLNATLLMATTTSFAERACKLRLPTLVIGGRLDTIFLEPIVRHWVRSELPHARAVFCRHQPQNSDGGAARGGSPHRRVHRRPPDSTLRKNRAARSHIPQCDKTPVSQFRRGSTLTAPV